MAWSDAALMDFVREHGLAEKLGLPEVEIAVRLNEHLTVLLAKGEPAAVVVHDVLEMLELLAGVRKGKTGPKSLGDWRIRNGLVELIRAGRRQGGFYGNEEALVAFCRTHDVAGKLKLDAALVEKVLVATVDEQLSRGFSAREAAQEALFALYCEAESRWAVSHEAFETVDELDGELIAVILKGEQGQ